MNKKTIVFDFDGVIHSYTSGWTGADNIPDPPVENIEIALEELHQLGYEIVVVSTRTATPEGAKAVMDWLDNENLLQFIDKIQSEKPPAIVYVDDRAICFDGDPLTLFLI